MPQKTDIFLLKNEGYRGFFTKSIVPLIDRQFMGTLDPSAVAEILQSNIVKVCFFYILILSLHCTFGINSTVFVLGTLG